MIDGRKLLKTMEWLAEMAPEHKDLQEIMNIYQELRTRGKANENFDRAASLYAHVRSSEEKEKRESQTSSDSSFSEMLDSLRRKS